MSRFAAARQGLARLTLQGLLTLEFVVTLPVFVLAWLLSALWRAMLLGWAVSGMEQEPKRTALGQLLGRDDHAG